MGTSEGDRAARGAGSLSSGQGREGLEGKLGSGSKASDELGSEREDLVEVERGVEGCSEGLVTVPGTDVRGMAGLNGQDGASSAQVGLVGDGRGSAEVSGNTNTLEDGRETDEGVEISDGEGEGRLSDSLVAESAREECDVSLCES